MRNFKPFLIFLMGPTASGKSKLAMKLRKYLPIELISVDSALIYRYMNIGTAKPSFLQLSKHPHRLIDFKDPSDFYSAAEFRLDALKEIKNILDQGKIPLLVGGTMFYYYVLLNGISSLPISNLEVRKKILSKNYNNKSDYLYTTLSKIDIHSAKTIHPNDSQRLLRALEVFYITGKKLSELKKLKKDKLLYKVIQFAQIPNKKYLYNNIENRFQNMLNQGFEFEVKSLLYRGDLHLNLPSMRCIGYRYMWSYLSNKMNYNDMVFQSILSTKQLVKRQITWLKNWKNIYYLYNININILLKEILNIIYKLKLI